MNSATARPAGAATSVVATDRARFDASERASPLMGVFEIEGGRIKAWREYFDLAPVREAYS